MLQVGFDLTKRAAEEVYKIASKLIPLFFKKLLVA